MRNRWAKITPILGLLTLTFCLAFSGVVRAQAQDPALVPASSTEIASNPANIAASAQESCRPAFDSQRFCEQLIHTQNAFRVEGGYEVRTNACPGLTSASMILFQDQGKDLFKVQCELHCGPSKARNTIRFAELLKDPWSNASDTYLRQHDACGSGADYSKLIESYQKQMGEDYTQNN